MREEKIETTTMFSSFIIILSNVYIKQAIINYAYCLNFQAA